MEALSMRHTGLLKLADNEAELASVIGREIGHIAEMSYVEQMRDSDCRWWLSSVAGLDSNKAVRWGLAPRRPLASRQADQKLIKGD